MPGVRAERRLTAWSGLEWSGVLAHADHRGRDAFAFAFEPVASPYLKVADDLVVWTPYSWTVVAALREVPWARWDPVAKAWRVPFRSVEDLLRRWPAIEEATRRAEPEERRKRDQGSKASAEHGDRGAEAAECRWNRYPVPEAALPPLGRVLMTHTELVVFEAVTGDLGELVIAARFYPGVAAGPAVMICGPWRRSGHAELAQALARVDTTSAVRLGARPMAADDRGAAGGTPQDGIPGAGIGNAPVKAQDVIARRVAAV